MKVFSTIYLVIFLMLVSCSTTKTTKVYIEVGVNDYTKTTGISSSSGYSKTKRMDSGEHPIHAGAHQKPIHSKKAPR